MTTTHSEITFSKFNTDDGKTGTVTVKGITEENYGTNRVFRADGKRWVLQNRFGCDCYDGTEFFFVRQADLDPTNFTERATHLLN